MKPSNLTDYYIKLNIRKSPIQIDVLRSYLKLDGLLAYLGGFLLSFKAVFSSLVSIVKKFSFCLEISNS